MRWRPRLGEFDFEVKYKKGNLNTQADALSRLPTSGETTVSVDGEIPCFLAQLPPGADTEEPSNEIEELDYSGMDALLTAERY